MPCIKADQIYGVEILTKHLEIFGVTTRNLPSISVIMLFPDLASLILCFYASRKI